MENFEVSITLPNELDRDIYMDSNNCYLAQVLRKQFPDKEIKVVCVGYCGIDNVGYRPLKSTPFGSKVIQDNLGKTLTIKFEKYDWL